MDFLQYEDVHLPAVILKTFLRDLPEPLLTFGLYSDVVNFYSEWLLRVLIPTTGVASPSPPTLFCCPLSVLALLTVFPRLHDGASICVAGFIS